MRQITQVSMRCAERISKKDISGTECYVIKKKNHKPKRAVLYLFGGGY
jgi:hypothetical protein